MNYLFNVERASAACHAIIELPRGLLTTSYRSWSTFTFMHCDSRSRLLYPRIYIIKWNFRFDNFIFIHHRLIQLVIYRFCLQRQFFSFVYSIVTSPTCVTWVRQAIFLSQWRETMNSNQVSIKARSTSSLYTCERRKLQVINLLMLALFSSEQTIRRRRQKYCLTFMQIWT